MSLGGERLSGGICGRAHHGRRVCGRFPFHSPLQVKEAFDIRGQELWGFRQTLITFLFKNIDKQSLC